MAKRRSKIPTETKREFLRLFLPTHVGLLENPDAYMETVSSIRYWTGETYGGGKDIKVILTEEDWKSVFNVLFPNKNFHRASKIMLMESAIVAAKLKK